MDPTYDAPRNASGRPAEDEGPIAGLVAWARRHRGAATIAASLLALLVYGLLRWNEGRGEEVTRLRHAETVLRERLARTEAARRREEGGALLALAHVELERRPALALQLALRGSAQRPGRAASATLAGVLTHHREVHRFYAHDGPVRGLCLVPGRQRVLTWDRTGLLLLGDLDTGAVVARHVVPGGTVSDALVLDGGAVVVATPAGSLHVWRPGSDGDDEAFDVPVAEAALTALAATGEGVAVGGSDGRLLLVDAVGARSVVREIEPSDAPIVALAASADGELASLDGAGRVRRIDPADGTVRWRGTLPGADAARGDDGEPPRGRLAWIGPDGALGASLGVGRLRVWTAEGHPDDIGGGQASCVGWAAAREAARVAVDLQPADPSHRGPGAVLVWDVGRPEPVARFVGLPRVRGAAAMALSRDGGRIAWTLGEGGLVAAREIARDGAFTRLAGHQGRVAAVAFLDAAGDGLVTIGADRTARAWRVDGADGATGRAWPGGAWNAGFWRATSGSSDETVGGAPAWVGEAGARPGALALSPDGTRAALVGVGGDLRVVARDGDGARSVFEADAAEHEAPAVAVALGDAKEPERPATGLLVRLAEDGTLEAFDLGTGGRMRTKEDVPDGAFALVVSPDGASVAVVAPTLVQVRRGVDLDVLQEHRVEGGPIARARIGAHGEGVVLVAEDGRTQTWPFDVAALARERLPAPIHPEDMVRLEIGTPPEIHDAGDRYVDHQPSARDAYGLGRGRLANGRLEEARARFEEAMSLRPDLPLGDYGLALIDTTVMASSLPGTPEHDHALHEAVTHLGKALDVAPIPEAELRADPLLAPLRECAEFQQVLEAGR